MMSIVLLASDRLRETKGITGLLPHVTRGHYELIVVDAGGRPDTHRFYHEQILPRVPRLHYVRLPGGMGLPAALNAALGLAAGDVVAFLHADLFLYAPGWNEQVERWLRDLPNPGVIGFRGYTEVSREGEALDPVSSWVDAEDAGRRLHSPHAPVALVDDTALICTRALLNRLQGLDLGYRPCPLYGPDLSMAALHLGFTNWVVNVPAGHVGGAACGPGGDPASRAQNRERFARKWATQLPVRVAPDARLERGEPIFMKRDPRSFVPIPADQKVTVDLGCANGKKGLIGIARDPGPGVDIVCNLGFEPMPFTDSSVDYFIAHDFLEHIPGYVFYREGGEWKRLYPRIELLREIHRCLRPGGRFESFTPCHPFPQWAQDPTHTSPPWVPESWPYFCGTYRYLVPGYGIDFEFRLVLNQVEGYMLHTIVEKP